jgi:hypothetical protein
VSWPGDLEAILMLDEFDPWRHDDGRYCPSCRRAPRASVRFEEILLAGADEALRE